MTNEDLTQKITAIIAKCWSDKAFKQELLTNTAATLQAEGVQVPAGYTVKVMENTNDTLNFILPPNPNGELSDMELESVAGGKPSPGEIAILKKKLGNPFETSNCPPMLASPRPNMTHIRTA